MRLSDLKVGFRQLISNPGYALVLLVGYALAIATAFLLWAFTIVSLQTDLDIAESNRIFRVESLLAVPGATQGWDDVSPMPLKEAWQRSGAPVEFSTRLYPVEMSIKVDGKIQLRTITFVDPEFVDLFPVATMQGDLRKSLQQPDSIAMSDRAAQQLFGKRSALGQSVLINGGLYSVGAIYPTRPRESAFGAELLMSIKSQALPEKWRLESWAGFETQTFVKLLPNARLEDLVMRAKEQLEDSPYYRSLPPGLVNPGKSLWTPRAVALTDLRTKGAGSEKTQLLLMSLAIATVMIFLLAGINFVNLITVRIAARQSEIGVRKALGGRPAQIATLFLTESILVVLIAFILALPIAYLFALAFEAVSNVYISSAMFNGFQIPGLLIVSALIGALSGIYPAWIAYRTKVASVITGRGSQDTGAGIKLRRALTAFQFIIAIVLLGCSGIVYVQANFAAHVYPGFEADGLLQLDAPVNLKDPRLAAFRDAVAELPDVSSVALSEDVPGRGKSFSAIEVKDDQGNFLSLALVRASPDFFTTYGIKATAGRIFERSRDKQGSTDVAVISDLAVKRLGYSSATSAIGRSIYLGKNARIAQIIGVVPDIHLRNLREKLVPTVYVIGSVNVQALTIRARDYKVVNEGISALWPRYFPDESFRIEQITNHISRNYAADRQLAGLIAVAALIALTISACGAYILVGFNVERKTREIILRRLYGAGSNHIVGLIAKEFLWLIVVGLVLGAPIVFLTATEYLSQFNARSPAWPLGLVFAVLIISATVLLSTIIHIRTALRIRPSKAFT